MSRSRSAARSRIYFDGGIWDFGGWSLDVVASRVLGWAAVDLLPDVVQVVTPAQGSDTGRAGLCHRGPEATELTAIVRWYKGAATLGVDSRVMN